MPNQQKKTNNFNDRLKTATIIGVNPQEKTIDIQYTTQDGKVSGLTLPYQTVGATYGRLHMPQLGDRVLVDATQGDRPMVVGMKATNPSLLPYLDPGELVDTCSDGSFIHYRNQRRRVKSTGELIDYSETKGPNGEKDIELEPGGIVIGVRSSKEINTKSPRWDEHSYLSMFDNGDVAIQSRYKGKEKGLFFIDGSAGYSFWTAGDGRPQEYIELDPVNKTITILSDGDVHQHTQKDWKITVYGSETQNIGDALQINVGLDVSKISGDFDDIKPDTDLQKGDIRIDNHQTTGTGKFYAHIKGDVNLTLEKGNVNINVIQGDINVQTAKGNIDVQTVQGNVSVSTAAGEAAVTANGDVLVTSTEGSISLSAPGGSVNLNSEGTDLFLNGGGSEEDRVATIKDIQNHQHAGIQSGPSLSGKSTWLGTSRVMVGQ